MGPSPHIPHTRTTHAPHTQTKLIKCYSIDHILIASHAIAGALATTHANDRQAAGVGQNGGRSKRPRVTFLRKGLSRLSFFPWEPFPFPSRSFLRSRGRSPSHLLPPFPPPPSLVARLVHLSQGREFLKLNRSDPFLRSHTFELLVHFDWHDGYQYPSSLRHH